MARLVYGLNQSLDGYVDHDKGEMVPDAVLFRHFIDRVRDGAGCLYGHRLYEIMRYWDDEQPGWDAAEREFAQVWRSARKWVASRSTPSLGPNATLLEGDLKNAVLRLKEEHEGDIDVGGPDLAQSLTELGLIDEYRLYLHPVVLGGGNPFFHGPRPPLRLTASERIGEAAILLTYVPAS